MTNNYSQNQQLLLWKGEFKGDAKNQHIGIATQDKTRNDTNNILTSLVLLLEMILALITISRIDKQIVIE